MAGVTNGIFVYFMTGQTSIVGCLYLRTNMKPGEHTKITFNMGNAHLFSPDGGHEALT